MAFSLLRFLEKHLGEGPEDGSYEIREVPIDAVRPNPYQPRRHFDEKAIAELAQSIAEIGLIQPIVVREAEDGYELIAGERRWRACKMLGKSSITALVVKAASAELQQVIALVENMQREDLNPLEEAESIFNILRLTNLTQEELARKLGKTQATISNKLRLLKLEPEVKEALRRGELGERQARSLVGLQREQQLKMLESIREKALSAEELEKKVREMRGNGRDPKRDPSPPAEEMNPFKRDLERLLNKWTRRGLKFNIEEEVAEEEGLLLKVFVSPIRGKKNSSEGGKP